MDDGALDDIHRFTASVEKPDLYAYLDIEPSADREAITHALQVRRSWAQGQQANPKYRQEALWVIKNISLLKEALTSGAEAYQSDLSDRDERVKLDTLSMFIKGTLADGELTARGEEAIQNQAKEMGLPESLVIRRIGEILAEQDAQSMADPPPERDTAGDISLEGVSDLYKVLDTPPDSDQETLEAAYRRRYRWARQLRDTEQSSRVYAKLDEAWRTLKDPERRAAYDEQRGVDGPSAETETMEQGFLPPPPPKLGITLPVPSVEKHLERVRAGEIPGPGTPTISIPEPQPERAAPPPPAIPEMGEFDGQIGDFIEEPEVSVEDWSTDDASLSNLSLLDLEPAPDSPPDDATPVDSQPATPDTTPDDLSVAENTDDLSDDLQGIKAMDLSGMLFHETADAPDAPDTDPDTPDIADIADIAEEPAISIPDFGASTGQPSTLETENVEGADILGDMLSLGDLVAGQRFEDLAESTQASTDGLPSTGNDGLDLGPASSPAPPAPTGPALDAGQLFNDLAILRVDGPRVIRIRTGAHPFPVRITVRNEGEGAMPGTVSTDVPWIQVSPKKLDPKRSTQIIEALVEPDGIPGNAGKGVVMIDTLHGESRTVTIDALKHIVSPVMMFVAALSLVGIVGLFAGLYLSGIIGSPVDSPERTILAVNVDPPAGEVYINDEIVGNQGTMSIVDNFPIGSPFQLRVELDGFEPFVRDIEVNHGDQFRVEVDLQLRDAVDYEPPEGADEAILEDDTLDALLEQRATHLDACFTRNLRTSEPYRAEVTVRGVVSARGFIQGIAFGDSNFRSPAVDTCIRRQLRALKLPLLAGDFARFERRMGAEIRDVTVLNEGTAP